MTAIGMREMVFAQRNRSTHSSIAPTVEITMVEARAKSSDSLSKGSTKMSHLLR
jgi:hypothetical protein